MLMILRPLIGLFLLVDAGLWSQATTSETLLKDNRSLLEQLSSPREPTEQEKSRYEKEKSRYEEEWYRLARRLEDELREKILRIERMVEQRRSSLSDVSLMFEFVAYTTGMEGSHFIAACLIDDTGKVYTFDAAKDPSAQATISLDELDFKQARSLAKSLGDEVLRSRNVGSHLGISQWTVHIGSTKILLKLDGDAEGELSGSNAIELIKLLDGWCPYATVLRSRANSLFELFNMNANSLYELLIDR
jgi:hypothetical protein